MKIDRGQVSALSTRGTRQILVVGVDDSRRDSMRADLIAAGFGVTIVPDGNALLDDWAVRHGADLILLEWGMGGVNGLDVLRHLRHGGDRVPVIFLTKPSDRITDDAVRQAGAVEFVDRSRSFLILRRRIDLLLEGVPPTPSTMPRPGDDDFLTIGRLDLNPGVGRAFWGGVEVDLTLTEFRIVDTLARRAGTDVRYREIYNLVHGEGFVAGIGDEGYRANVRAFIKRIRRKFRGIDPAFGCIENYPRFGYRWRSGR